MSDVPNPLDAQLVRFSTMLTVRNLSVSETYYVRHFGFKLTESMEGLRFLERPGVALYLISESPPTLDKPNVTLAPPAKNRPSSALIFRVSDARATHEALEKLGVKFLSPPQQPGGAAGVASLKTPAGISSKLNNRDAICNAVSQISVAVNFPTTSAS